jgi:hypothetical protein
MESTTPEEIFLSEQNPISSRWAVMNDDGLSAWLYLTEPNSEEIIGDCWLYNRISHPRHPKVYIDQGLAPPAPLEYIVNSAMAISPDTSKYQFLWSQDGESVAFFADDILMGFIAAGQKQGYSLNLAKAGGWGNILEEDLYRLLFIHR